jgi:hypothetical protein
MRIPQVSERVKEAPAHALRAVFAGIGQLLLITDRLRNRPSEDQVPRPREPEPDGQVTQTPEAEPAAGAPAATPAVASSDAAPAPAAPAPAVPAPAAGRTGNVRLLPDGAEAPAAKTSAAGTPATETSASQPVTAAAPAAETAAAEMPAAGTPAAEAPAAETPAAGTPAAEMAPPREAAVPAPAGPEPPIPNYEQLSLASLRARLRGLTLVQVRELIVYERGHAGRQDVIAMYERRIAKLESPEG